jgi:hypothetical protein
VYLSSADKQEGNIAVPRSPLTSVQGLAVALLWLLAQVWNIMFLDKVFPVSRTERTGEFSNYPIGLLQSLLGLLHKSYSDYTPFQEALGVLKFSHRLQLKVFSLIHCFI